MQSYESMNKSQLIAQLATAQKLELYFRPHEYGGLNRVRVWRNNWGGDQFEILSRAEFETLRAICMRFAIPMIEQED